jgi:NADH:ubiquinone oxidoreductase subunit 2 (subunit N)
VTFPKSNSPGAMNLGAVAVVVLAERNLRDFAVLSRTSPVARVAMVIFLVSLVGMPPLAATVAVGLAAQLILGRIS